MMCILRHNFLRYNQVILNKPIKIKIIDRSLGTIEINQLINLNQKVLQNSIVDQMDFRIMNYISKHKRIKKQVREGRKPMMIISRIRILFIMISWPKSQMNQHKFLTQLMLLISIKRCKKLREILSHNSTLDHPERIAIEPMIRIIIQI